MKIVSQKRSPFIRCCCTERFRPFPVKMQTPADRSLPEFAQYKKFFPLKTAQRTRSYCKYQPFIGTKPTRSLTTSPPMMSPTTDGTKALEPGTERRRVHLR